MALGYINFADDTLGALPSYLTVDDDGGTGTITVETLAGSLSGNALRFNRTASNFKQLVRVNTADDFDFGEVVALVRVDGQFAIAGVWARINDAAASDPSGMGYTYYNNAGSLYRYPDSSTVLSTGATGSSHAFGTATIYTGPKRVWMRMNWADNGTNVDFSFKSWDVDAESEPVGWDHTATIADGTYNVAGPGKPGIGCSLQGGAFGDTLWIEALGWSTDPTESASLVPIAAGGGSSPGPGGSREFFPGSRGNGFIYNKLR